MELIKEFILYIRDNSVKKISKLFVAVVIFLSLLFIDNISGFSFYHNIDQKLIELQKVSTLLENKNLDNNVRKDVLEIQKKILTRKTIKDHVFDSFSRISYANSKAEIIQTAESSMEIRNSIIEFISINYFFIFLILFMPLNIFLGTYSNSILKNILIALGTEIFLVVLTFTLFFIFSLIPTILNKPYLNYILNFIIVAIGLSIITWRISKRDKTYS